MKFTFILVLGFVGCILNMIMYLITKDAFCQIAAGVALIVIQNEYNYQRLINKSKL
jgi:hypothetical protein